MGFLKLFLIVALVFFLLSETASQQKSKIKTTSRKVPKYSISFMGGFGYVLGSANGDGRGFTSQYNLPGGNLFISDNLGMQQGYGIMTVGKVAIDKKKKTRITGTLGYNLFYNSEDRGRNRTKWHIFNLGAGVEYHFTPKQRQRLFVGYELDYTLTFGAWQSDILYPDGYLSNIYTKFSPASRLGMAATAGMEFRLSRKMDLIVEIRGVWANLFPRNNSYTSQPYDTYINDSKSNSGIELMSRKDIIYMQVVTGITLPLKYK
ncbi:MAG: hypothetical protein L0Y79_11555 [Chlorobi bacterium]|nr:hypothetical protein [Chlorobiota bacterium]MCI0715335.1 hypothetical protein [Chlorobiota bacterium]